MGETYAGAGVDIAAGEAAVQRIKDKVRSTYRPEVLGDIGGFGGLFTALDLGNAGDVTLITEEDHFLFTPMLYEYLSGEVEGWHIAPKYQELLDEKIDHAVRQSRHRERADLLCLVIHRIALVDVGRHRLGFHALQLLFRNAFRYELVDFAPQRVITSAGIIKKSRAQIAGTRTRLVKQNFDLPPAFRRHVFVVS